MATATTSRFSISWVVLVWLIIGVIVAINQDYADSLDNASQIVTFILGVVLWPVLATGGDVAITF
jgi:ABC-type Na+ efflux pump permease subunit